MKRCGMTSSRRSTRWKVNSAFTSAGSSTKSLELCRGNSTVSIPAPSGGENLLANAADGQDAAGEGHFAGHRQVAPDRFATEKAEQGRGDRHTRRRSVFRHRAGGDVNMNIGLAHPRRIELERIRVATEIAQGRLGARASTRRAVR